MFFTIADEFIFILCSATFLSPELSNIVLTYYRNEGVFSTSSAFAIKSSDGRVITWGNDCNVNVHARLKGVETMYSNRYAFAAKLEDGRVVTWGNTKYGGDSTSLQLKDVDTIYSTAFAFVAKLKDRTAVAWGNPGYGGDTPKSRL